MRREGLNLFQPSGSYLPSCLNDQYREISLMFNHHSVDQNITSIQPCNPAHLVKLQDRDGKTFLIQTSLIRLVEPIKIRVSAGEYKENAFIKFTNDKSIELELSVEELISQIKESLRNPISDDDWSKW